MQFRFILISLIFFPFINVNGQNIKEDSISKQIFVLVNRLDSLSHNDVQLETKYVGDGGSKSKKFQLYMLICETATTQELIYVVKNNKNPVVKGYAYIALLNQKYKQADYLISKNYLPLNYWNYDEGIYIKSAKSFIEHVKRNFILFKCR